MPASSRRAGSVIDDWGRYNSNVNGHVRSSAINALDTATWQFPILPSAPQYCRCTPTEWVPCLGKPVSSRAKRPVRTGISVSSRAQTWSARQGEWVMKWYNA